MADQNTRVVLASRPKGMPRLEDFRVEQVPIDPVGEGAALVGVDYLSIDAFIRTTLNDEAYHGSVPIGGTISALGVGHVLESRDPSLEAGDAVFVPCGAQTHAVFPAAMLQKVDEKQAPITAYLGVLGMTTGLTAYMGICEVGAVAEGETVVVSAAAGAVGSIAGQIAKLRGGRVIGIAGGADKVRYLTDELGLDAGIDYKGEDVDARLRELAPDGVDVFFDNVGGPILDIVLDQIRERARVVICGAISQYQNMDEVRGPSLYLRLAERHARMEGYAVTHFAEKFPEASAALAGWLAAGQVEAARARGGGHRALPGGAPHAPHRRAHGKAAGPGVAPISPPGRFGITRPGRAPCRGPAPAARGRPRRRPHHAPAARGGPGPGPCRAPARGCRTGRPSPIPRRVQTSPSFRWGFST